MNSPTQAIGSLPPEVLARLDEVRTTPEPAVGQATTTRVEVKSRAWYNPMKYIRLGVMGSLSLIIVGLVFLCAVMFAYIVGASVSSENAANLFARESPIKVEFKQGSVESYGFIRNFLFRNAEKTFEVASVVTTDYTGKRDLKDTRIKATRENGSVYQLKPGTKDVWVLMEQPARPSTAAPTTAATPATGK